jgi:hypothetical protein
MPDRCPGDHPHLYSFFKHENVFYHVREGDLFSRFTLPDKYGLESCMTTVFAYHRVADYNFWRAGYARAIAATPEVRSYHIWRGQDDPNYVITAENFDSREVAESVWTSEETKSAMKADGIDMSTVVVEYVDEAGFGSGPGLTT